MKYITVVILFFSLPTLGIAQMLNGKVYDSTTTVNGIKVYNESQKSVTVTDAKGAFSLPAKVGDSIGFESLFHYPKVVILKPIHFEGTAVFELKNVVNTLDEVEIKQAPKQPVFAEETYNIELQELIAEDIKNNPHKYKPQEEYLYGANLLAIIELVANLFKRKNKYRPPTYKPVTYFQIDSLFSKSSFFNERLLNESLEIPRDKRKLFFDFCAAKGISTELLQGTKKMELLDHFVVNSELFLILLEQYESGKNNKD